MKKTCTLCKKEKEITLFGKSKSFKSGYNSRCKECLYEKHRQFREANPSYRREYYLANKEKSAENSKRYYAEHREHLYALHRKAAKKNPELMRAYIKKSETKGRTELCDTYIRKMLSQYSTIGRADIPQILVEAKREQLKLLRSIKNGKSKNN